MRHGLKTAFLLALLAAVAPSLRGQEAEKEKQPPKEARVLIDIDPVGKPKSMKEPRMYVWWEGGRWNVRTHGQQGMKYQYNGTIRVQGGRVASFETAGDNEKKKRRGKIEDRGTLNADKTVISFALQTVSAYDGFSFRLSDEAQRLVFNVRVSGQTRPDVIAIGPQCEPPPSGMFVLPAEPGRSQ